MLVSKVMVDKLNGCIFDSRDGLLEKFNTIWDNVSADIKKDSEIASLSIIQFI